MSVEEAAQEVRRILRQNDVQETLHYLSTVTRSIEANQHDLRAAIGNSYRNLLSACDGVVGMERDCADILSIEAALDRRAAQATHGALSSEKVDSAAAATPLLPPEWFVRRQRRRRGTHAGKASGGGGAEQSGSVAAATSTAAGEGKENQNGQQQAGTHRSKKSAHDVHGASVLPSVELPLPPALADKPLGKAGVVSEPLNNDGASAHSLAELRASLDDQLQQLHLQYMALAEAMKRPGMVEAEMARVMTAVSDMDTGLTLSTDTTAAASAPGSAAQRSAVTHREGEENEADAVLPEVLPLLHVAKGLHAVQSTLRDLKTRQLLPVPTTADKAPSPSAVGGGVALSKPLPWVLAFHRRATTLETRLVKLLLSRLRAVADFYAQLQEGRAKLQQQTHCPPAAATPSTALPRTATGTAAAAATTDESQREIEAARQELDALAQTERRFLLYVCVVFAECHGALRALASSTTLIGALAACAPGVELPHDAMETVEEGEAGGGDGNREATVQPLFNVARRSARELVAGLVEEPMGGGTGKGEEAASIRLLLALLAVLLLREAQVSAARWRSVSRTASLRVDDKTATSDRNGASNAPASTHGAAPQTVRPRLFANAAVRSALGLPVETRSTASPAAAAAVGTATRTADTADSAFGESHAFCAAGSGSGVPNTVWALRCFTGLSFLLHTFTDYLDLASAAAAAGLTPQDKNEHTSKSPLPSLPTAVECVVVQVVAAFCAAQRGLVDGDTGLDVFAHHPPHSGYTTRSLSSGTRSLTELLQWRLLQKGGAAAAAVEGIGDGRRGTPSHHGSPLVHSTASGAGNTNAVGDGTPSGLYASPYARTGASPGRGDRQPETTPLRQSTSALTMSYSANGTTGDGGVSGVAGGAVGGGSGVVSSRAYIETLRASLTTIPELGTTRRQPRSAATPLSAVPNTNSRGGAVCFHSDLLPMMALQTVAHQLLTPVVTALVAALARDPVAIALFSYSAGDSAGGTGGKTSIAACSLSDVLCSTPFNTRSSAGVKEVNSTLTSLMASVGRTWTQLNTQQWWEQARTAALHSSLQRCFTVALDTVTLVERGILYGLLHAPSPATVGTHAGDDSSSDADAVPLSYSDVQSTLAALSEALWRHSLVSGGGVALGEASGGEREGLGDGSNRNTNAALHHSDGVRCGRTTAAAAGIDWSRFRLPSSAGTAPATASTLPPQHMSVDGGQQSPSRGHGPLRPSSSSSTPTSMFSSRWSQHSGEALFREEGIEWATAALHSAKLSEPLLLTLTQRGGTPVQPHSVGGEGSVAQDSAVMRVLLQLNTLLFSPQTLGSGRFEGRVAGRDGAERGDGSGCGGGLNGHVAELLHRCLCTLVSAVTAFSSHSSSSSDVPNQQQSAHNDVHANTTQAVVSFERRVVAWLAAALDNIDRLLTAAADGGAGAQGQKAPSLQQLLRPATVSCGYEMALVLRVYGDVLEQLSGVVGGETAAEVRRLCTVAEQLSRRANAPWQQLVLCSYGSALRRVYTAHPKRGGERRRTAVAAPSNRLSSLINTSTWMRAETHNTASGGPRADSAVGRGLAYPALPTPGLTQLTQQTLRLLHHIFYGRPSIYTQQQQQHRHRQQMSAAAGGPGTEAESLAASGAAGALPLPEYEGNGGGVVMELVSPQERRHILQQLVQTTAEVFERDLLPLLVTPGGESAPSPLRASDIENIRLQWYMDVLFASSVWCVVPTPSAASTALPSSGQAVTAGGEVIENLLSHPPSAALTSLGGLSDPRAVVSAGPLQSVATSLASACDAVRWRSTVPLMLAAYRQYLSASAALWVVRGLESSSNNNKSGGSNDDAAGSGRGTTVAMVAATRPYTAATGTLSSAAATSGAYSTSSAATLAERVLQPRERIDRLALLPIAASSAAVAVAAAAGASSLGGAAGGATHGSSFGPAAAAFSIPAPTAAALNPYQPQSGSGSSSGGPLNGQRLSAAGSALSLPPNAFHSPAPADAGGMFYDGAAAAAGSAGAAGMRGAAAGAGAGASSAAAAASSLWGTTQRGWSQLWGSS